MKAPILIAIKVCLLVTQHYLTHGFVVVPSTADSRSFFFSIPTSNSLSLKAGTSLLSTKENQLMSFQPIFNFTDESRRDTEKFERIDDVIMGGISTSSLRQIEGEPFARWSGICRLDGGGFCGVRTLPFTDNLEVLFADGIYVKCRLSSDRDANKRIWKVTTRTERSRGEQLYQAMFEIPPGDEWATIRIPFSNFTLVRGARKVKDGEPFDVVHGIYQIGFTMSKFKIGDSMTVLDDFRPGFFELQFQEIGFYAQSNLKLGPDVPRPVALTKEQARKQRPLLLKLLLPLSKIFFTEESQRRKSAMKTLMKSRGLSRVQAIMFGVRCRARKQGYARASMGALQIVLVDTMRSIARSILRYGVLFPMRCVQKIFQSISAFFTSNKRGKTSRADASSK